jgi:peptide/nickel transport system substrate-binding protein
MEAVIDCVKNMLTTKCNRLRDQQPRHIHSIEVQVNWLCFLIRFVLLATFPLATAVNALDAVDTVILAWPTQPDSLFPDYARSSNSHFLLRHLYSSLVTTDLEGNLVPDLAESWELSDDQLTWTFNLRHDVVWHDGAPFTAADVKYTFEMSADPDFTGWTTNRDILGVDAKRAGEADAVAGVQVMDDYAVTITTTSPNALMLEVIGTRDILPAHILQDIPISDLPRSSQTTLPIGTGPYRLVEWRTDEILRFEAFPNYFGETARIPNLVWKVVPETSNHYTELVTGSSDVSVTILADDFPALAQEPGMATLRFPGVNFSNVMFNVSSPYFNDVRTRQAIAYAIDRESIITAIGAGFGTIVTSIVHPDLPEYNRNIEPYSFDPDIAAQFLAEVGWRDDDGDGTLEAYDIEGLENGSPFMVELGTTSQNQLTAQIIQQNLEAVGIAVEINVVDFNIYRSEYLTAEGNPNFQFGINGWFNLFVPTQQEISSAFTSETDYGHFWHSAQVEELVANAPSIFDAEERNAAYFEIQAILYDELPWLYLMRLDNLIAYDDRLLIPEVGSLTAFFQSIPQWTWES